ncbi:DUF1028 domain-containing protein [Thioclava nitratireducens]|uniref:DUF1028 domain-containing protein n=1 Tax=Thioclava nitratireducens TaxID=1915078 RepID=UPI002448E867|nr:DUF1028 domain-containing protein [Thioclava nitratireducens]
MRANYHDKCKGADQRSSAVTVSILAYDEKTGTFGGAAMTGSLCVGGWVLRGGAESGLSASQGTAPSTLWGEDVLEKMKTGMSAGDAVAQVTDPDTGRAHRQLAAIDLHGNTGHFTGEMSVPICGALEGRGVVVSGNMLADWSVIAAVRDTYLSTKGAMPDRLMAALVAGARAGGDSRGLLSAALLVASRAATPLTLRIDRSAKPLEDLADLLAAARAEPYHGWTRVVPTLDDPYRAPDLVEPEPLPLPETGTE